MTVYGALYLAVWNGKRKQRNTPCVSRAKGADVY
jgi:hypothetical protein